MLKWLKNRLKWALASKELEELYKRRALMSEYQRWLSEFQEVSMTLENYEAEIQGKALNACWPPTGHGGPWMISGLREILRIERGTSALSK